jgi:hypothetical protein
MAKIQGVGGGGDGDDAALRMVGEPKRNSGRLEDTDKFAQVDEAPECEDRERGEEDERSYQRG